MSKPSETLGLTLYELDDAIDIDGLSENFRKLDDAAAVLGQADATHAGNTENPHRVTAAQVGAAVEGHGHTAAQIGAAAAGHTHTAAQIGAAAAGHTHTAAQVGAATAAQGTKADNALPRSGGTMTGNISYTMHGATRTPMQIYSGNASGLNVVLCGGGATILGSGEAPSQVTPNVPESEMLHLASDDGINLYTNLQNGWANRKTVFVDKAGELYVQNGTKRVYHTGYKPTAADVGALAAAGTAANSSKWGNFAVSRLTQAQYDGLGYKDANTVYLIVG